MAESNWTVLTGSLGGGNVLRGVTSGIAKPNGGGTFVYGFNSVSATEGIVGLYTNQANFIPTAKGGTVTAAIKRGASASPTGSSCFIFIGAQGTAVADNAYMLGLSDAAPCSLILRKGPLVDGIVDGELGDSNIILKSTDSFSDDEWLHIRLDMIVNPSGDVILKVWQSDLTGNTVSSPSWAGVSGMDDFTDDALGVNSGTAPFITGYMGFGFQSSGISRRAFFDHITCARQV